MSRELDLDRLSVGDTVVVEVNQTRGRTAMGDTKNCQMTILQCDAQSGELAQAEIIEIDRNNEEITAVSEEAESAVEEYAVGDKLTVSVDDVINEDAQVSLGPKSTLKILDYPYKSEDIEVIVTDIQGETVLTHRLVEVNEVSRSQLVDINQANTVEVRVSPELTMPELNVFISHLLAADNWDILEEIFSGHSDTEKTNISLAAETLRQRSTPAKGVLRDMLYTATAEKPELAPVFGGEYLGAVIHDEAYPRAWENSIKGNFAVYCSNHDIKPAHSPIAPVNQLKVESTISANQLFVEGRRSKTRDHSINRKLREVWDEHCAVCGHQAKSRHDKTGIEGSHIYPVQFGGPDKVGNILPMCRNDHWAFENGWISITDNYTIEYHAQLPEEVAGLLQADPGDQLVLQEGYEPDRDYLVLHRRIHGFDPIEVGQRFPLVMNEVGAEGVKTMFPSGKTLIVPYEAIGEGDDYSRTVVVTDINDEIIRAVPIKK